MATVTATNAQGAGRVTVTETTLDGSSDGFTYTAARNPILTLRNPTGSPITPVIDGSGSSAAYPVRGVGTIDLTNGYSVGAIAAGAAVTIKLSTIDKYLSGTVAINSGSGLVATLLHY